jgi:hypothetical protein
MRPEIHVCVQNPISKVLLIILKANIESNILPLSAFSFFYHIPSSAIDNLKDATIFTRLHLQATPQAVQNAVSSMPELQNTFLLVHLNRILLFDHDREQHSAHLRAVLAMLQRKGIEFILHLSAWFKPSWKEAGFDIWQPGEVGHVLALVLREHLGPELLEALDLGQ